MRLRTGFLPIGEFQPACSKQSAITALKLALLKVQTFYFNKALAY